jgi:hypothetical protein
MLNSMMRWTSIIIVCISIPSPPVARPRCRSAMRRSTTTMTSSTPLGAGPRVPAIASFKVVWGGSAKPYTASDASFVFKGLQTEATIKWSASGAGFEFDSDRPQTSKAVFAAFGKERNGVFRNKT